MRKLLTKIQLLILLCCSLTISSEVTTVNASVAKDAAWSWWTYPVMTVSPQNQKAYFGFISSQGEHGVGIYNPSTGRTWEHLFPGKGKPDDHNAPAVSVLPNGKILVVFTTGHNKDNKIHVYVSKTAGNVNSWEPEVVLKSSGKTTYIQMFRYDGKTWIFYRRKMDSKWAWCYRHSSNLRSWSSEKVVSYANPQYYCLFRETTKPGLLRFIATANPALPETDFKMGFFDMKSETVYQADMTKIKKADSIGVGRTKLKTILKKEEGTTQRLFDLAVTDPDDVLFSYCVINSNHTLATYYIYDNGKSEKMTTSKKAFPGDGSTDTYFSGMNFVNNNKLIAATRGDKDKIIIITLKNRKKDNVNTLTTSTKDKLIRPIACGNVLMWQKGSHTSYKKYDLDAVFVSH